jgi:hypothetical protein
VTGRLERCLIICQVYGDQFAYGDVFVSVRCLADIFEDSYLREVVRLQGLVRD